MRVTMLVACVLVLAFGASVVAASPYYGYGWQQQIKKPCVYGKQRPYYQSYGQYGQYGQSAYGRSGYGYSGYQSPRYNYGDYYRSSRRYNPWSQWRQSYGRGGYGGRYW